MDTNKLEHVEAIYAYTVARISGKDTNQSAHIVWDIIRKYKPIVLLQDHPLYYWLMQGNTIPAARCSSAKAKGRAKNYAYWGAARYEIYWSNRHSGPVAYCARRAHSDRRSHDLAINDTYSLAKSLNGVVIGSIGYLTKPEQTEIEAWYLEEHYKQTLEAGNFNKINLLYDAAAS
jgi:hypothetical protein